MAWQTPVWAESVKNLYSAEVLVQGQDAESRAIGMKQALTIVLGKVSGSRLAADPAFLQRLGDAGRYARTFGYRETDETLTNDAGKQVAASRMKVSFDANGVMNLARELNMPIWGANRPSVLVWLIEERRGQREVVANGGTGPLNEALAAESDNRGLPVVLPIMDINDRTEITDTELWGLFAEPIVEASTRYNPGAILAGRFYRNASGQLIGRWMMIFRGERSSISVTSVSEQALVQQGMDLAVQELAKRYAVQADEISELPAKLLLSGVYSADDYAQAMAYLQQMTAVRGAKPLEVQGDLLTLHLTIDGGLQQLQEVIALDSRMQPQPQRNELEPIGSRSLYYQWLGAQ
ncbi:DUF2066 domain-containing protein [Aestuariirhabdus sp. Z084]|uniref:DUF2066 domain-containing protein n=1 Tax=Aestuariirhabdus haliotis TaxID=2918751 RepID=UPI00201B36D1|nr:DUF2066 domain-containing protein [Aestuariirhabdus haliotis]MCL6416294.1 DUF2066 domain-containing protein [Aestuariirhabdus haliotis]MCL6420167.1 DUF2066 domain-containing protein [Aestuariirhabdus haliotis]